MSSSPLSRMVLAIALALMTAGIAHADGRWLEGFHLDGPNGGVVAMQVFRDELVLAGSFTNVGGFGARNVVALDGTDFRALGDGLHGAVATLCEWRGDLIAGGAFSLPGAMHASNVARWDGFDWHPLGEGPPFLVTDLVVFGDDLVACGLAPDFPDVSQVARWDGSGWDSLGIGLEGVPRALAVFRGELYAGSFAYLPGPGGAALEAFVWRLRDGVWEPLEPVETGGTWGIGPDIHDLVAVEDRVWAVGVKLWMGTVGGNLVYWDGVRWFPAGSFPRWWTYEDEWFTALCPFEGTYVLGGSFWGPGEGRSQGIAMYDGSVWTPFPGGGVESGQGALRGPEVSRLATYGADLYAAGGFTVLGDRPVNRLARWDGREWNPVGTPGWGILGTVESLAWANGRLYAGGSFIQAGGSLVSTTAVFDGEQWRPLGGGTDGRVRAMVPAAGGVIAGGSFSRAGDLETANIALWDGAAWRPLGDGLDHWVAALCRFEGNVVAGGRFESSGSRPLRYVGRWDGQEWSPIGEGLGAAVLALTVHQGLLVAGGDFDGHVAIWRDGSWRRLPGLTYRVSELASLAGDLFVVGGRGGPGEPVSRWDGHQWHAVSGGLQLQRIDRLTVHGRALVGIGSFRDPESGESISLARWTGESWVGLPGTLDGRVYAAAPNGQDLAIGGRFDLKGPESAVSVAVYRDEAWPGPPHSFEAGRKGSRVALRFRSRPDAVYHVWRAAWGTPSVRISADPVTGSVGETIDVDAPFAECEYWLEEIGPGGVEIAFYGPAYVGDLYAQVLGPTASWSGSGLTLEWTVAPEDSGAVFRVWRGVGDEPAIVIAPTVPHESRRYRLLDTDGPGPGERYRIEQVLADGTHVGWCGFIDPPRGAAGITMRIAPDPARGRRAVWLDLPGPGHVRLDLYDATGRRCGRFVDAVLEGGWSDLTLDPIGADGRRLPSGVYFLRLVVDGVDRESRRILWIR